MKKLTSSTWAVASAIIALAIIGFIFSRKDLGTLQQAEIMSPILSEPAQENRVELMPQKEIKNEPKQNSNSRLRNNLHTITIATSLGEIEFETYDADAPETVKNFITLAQKGFYNNLIFHRVVPGFVIQGGDPKGDGTGGPGYEFKDELNPETESYKAGYKKGVVAMANRGTNTNGSQFFIMLRDNNLPHNYTIFGKVIRGQDVVDVIGKVPTGAGDRPQTPVVMKEVRVETQ